MPSDYQLSAVLQESILTVYCVFCMVLIVSYVPPVLIEQLYTKAPTDPIAKAFFVWITDTGSRLHTAGVLCIALAMLGMLARDAYEGLSRLFGTGPIALKDGASVPAAVFSTGTLNATAVIPLTSQPSFTLNSKLQLLFVSTAFCAQQLALDDVISQLLLGLVLFGLGLTWLVRNRHSARGPAPASNTQDRVGKEGIVGEGSLKKAEV
ncbi:hypothetical protein C8R45DRAFT_629834 [Mycena sanguinolenta]|nr:hypothetical protein C8R45DRAFT_629834 [Mycena sanguinolenta]